MSEAAGKRDRSRRYSGSGETRPGSSVGRKSSGPSGTLGLSPNRYWRIGQALVFSLIATVLAYLALATIKGQNLDATTRFALSRGKHLFLGIDSAALSTISMGALLALTGAVLLVAVVRKRWQLGARVLLLVVGANVTTQVLKHWIIHRPNLAVDYAGLENSLPSGHATVAMTAALGIVMVSPLRTRSLAAFIGWITASFIGISVMLNEWHRLSDVLIAFLVAGIWGVILAPQERAARRFGRFHRVTLEVSAVLLVLGIFGLVGAWNASPMEPLIESALRDNASGNEGIMLALLSVSLIVGLSGAILSSINLQARRV